MKDYYRPIVQRGSSKPNDALSVCGGNLWFNSVEVLRRSGSLGFRNVAEFPTNFFKNITSRRASISSLDFSSTEIMGIVNLTPDSFSDGGDVKNLKDFSCKIDFLISEGAKIIDIGGESSKPGSSEVSYEVEKDRIFECLRFLSEANRNVIISVDTRKSKIAELAAKLKVQIINDVSAGTFDEKMLDIVKKYNLSICLCHSLGVPKTMNLNPNYKNVVLDVYDQLEEKVHSAIDAGISKDKILVDPGIGFGKTKEHNLDLIRNMSIFHGLGCAIVLGVSRKKFIRTTTISNNESELKTGSIFYSLEGVRQGVQIVRVHDVKEMKKCLNGYQALWA